MTYKEDREDSRRGIEFVRSTGSPVVVGRRDTRTRIREAMSDLQTVIAGVAQGPQFGNMNESVAVLARACSIFLRKMVLGERGMARKSRLLNYDICGTAGLGFDRVRKIAEHTPLNVSLGLDGGYFRAERLNESTLQPEAVYTLPIGVQKLDLSIEWPLPGMADWTSQPTEEGPWTIGEGQLFDLQSGSKLDCDRWLGQQLVIFDDQGVSLQQVLKITADTEGAHSSDVSRLMQMEGERRRAVRNWALHILSNITVCGMKYNHVIAIESALYLYRKLVDNESIERPPGEVIIPTFCFVPEDASSPGHRWLAFDGGLAIALGGRQQIVSHRVRTPR